MFVTQQITEGVSVCDVLNVTNVNNTNVNTIGVDISRFYRLTYLITNVGLNAAGTIDARLQSATDAAFTSPVNISGTSITQITGNYKLATVEVRADQVAQQNAGHKYVRLNLTGGGNALNCLAVGLGVPARQMPAKQFDLNSNYLNGRTVCNT